MQHIAIMKKKWNLIELILNQTKTIESRWYQTKRSPWNQIRPADIVFFKNSGEPVTAKATTRDVIQFDNLTPNKVKDLLTKHHKEIGIPKDSIPKFYALYKNKKYCILVFLKNPRPVIPFNINKKGFGLMSAWISLENINHIKNTNSIKK